VTRFEARIFGIRSDRYSKKEEEKERRIVDERGEGEKRKKMNEG
jgi:hypothetical protein